MSPQEHEEATFRALKRARNEQRKEFGQELRRLAFPIAVILVTVTLLGGSMLACWMGLL